MDGGGPLGPKPPCKWPSPPAFTKPNRAPASRNVVHAHLSTVRTTKVNCNLLSFFLLCWVHFLRLPFHLAEGPRVAAQLLVTPPG